MALRTSRRWGRAAGGLTATALLAGTAALAATPARAATGTETFDCGGTALTIAVPPASDSSENGGWGAARVVEGGSGTLIPTSFSQTAFDVTHGDDLFPAMTLLKGQGNANHMQDTITCTQGFSDTLGNLLAEMGAPPFPLPDWAQPGDTVVITFTVTAVARP